MKKRGEKMNKYYEKLKFVRTKAEKYLSEIFKVYGNELLLRLEEYNLLTNSNNCIETSTAIGFVMEEFIVSKLETYTRNHNGINEIKIERINGRSTIKSSYDCFTIYDGVFVMINIKVQKGRTANNAVAAINILHNDYVSTNQEQEKAYLVLKTLYDFGLSKNDCQRKILIKGLSGYYLEELDFSFGHKQDHRNWSMRFNANSGRLQVTEAWRKNHKLNEDEISYSKTKGFIDSIYNKKS